MPKRKPSRRPLLSPAKVPAQQLITDHVVLKDEMDLKIEVVDDEFDPMHSESTEMILVNAMNKVAEAVTTEPEIDAMKLENDVEIVNSFRPEMLENLHEFAYMMRSHRLQTHKENSPDKMVNETAKPKRKKKVAKRVERPKYEPVEVEVNGKKMVKCPLCNQMNTTRYRARIKNHIRQVHTQDTPFKCDYCDSKYSSLSALRSHLEHKHKKTKIQCENCRLIFYEAEKLELHKFKCVANRSMECYICSYKLIRFDTFSLKRHIRKMHTGETVFACTMCPEKFIDNFTLVRHTRRFHPEVMPFECSICRKKFQKKRSFQRHERKCRAKNRFECYLCQYTQPNMRLESLRLHMRKHSGVKPFQCSLCNKRCSRKQTLNDHLERHRETFTLQCVRCHRPFSHGNALAEHQRICRKRRYECYLCGFTNYGLSYNKFMRHMAIHTGIHTLKCAGCPKSFRSYNLLVEHVAKSDHTQLLATFCPNCCIRFPSRADRDAHQSKCSRKRFECYLCGRTTKTVEKLKNHITFNHTGAKRFKCKFCSRKFHRKSNWTKHEKTHTNVGLVKCQYCSKKFIDLKYKRKHENACKKTYMCYLCQRTFPSFKILHHNHMKTHSGRYHCKHCRKSSASARTYASHVVDKHLHLYKFQCQTCNGVVKHRKDLRTHQKSCNKRVRQVSGKNYFKCSLCGKGLARMLQVKEHMIFGECKNHPKER